MFERLVRADSWIIADLELVLEIMIAKVNATVGIARGSEFQSQHKVLIELGHGIDGVHRRLTGTRAGDHEHSILDDVPMIDRRRLAVQRVFVEPPTGQIAAVEKAFESRFHDKRILGAAGTGEHQSEEQAKPYRTEHESHEGAP